MSDTLRVSVDENTLIVVVRKNSEGMYEAFTEPHPIITGYGMSGSDAIKDMIGLFHEQYTRAKMMDKARALPMTQQGTLALMKKFSDFF